MTGARPVFGFPGANPPGPERVRPLGASGLLVRPFHETPAANYRFRLDLRLEVPRDRTPLRLEIDWGDEEFRHLRGTLYHQRLGGPGRWTAVREAGGAGPVTRFDLTLDRGIHHLTLNPKFDLDDLERLALDCAGNPAVEVERTPVAGTDAALTAFRLRSAGAAGTGPDRTGPDRAGQGRPVVLAVARVHPYETAGSHCLAGLVRRALHPGAWREELLARHDWLVAPVLSVPGVARGFCRHSGAGEPGLDLSRQAHEDDPLCAALLRLAGDARIAGYLDIHNWMHPGQDGVFYMNRLRTGRFQREAARRTVGLKPWRTRFRRLVLADRPSGLMQLVRERWQAVCCGLELPWHGRDPGRMAQIGAGCALAFQAAALEGSWPCA